MVIIKSRVLYCRPVENGALVIGNCFKRNFILLILAIFVTELIYFFLDFPNCCITLLLLLSKPCLYSPVGFCRARNCRI